MKILRLIAAVLALAALYALGPSLFASEPEMPTLTREEILWVKARAAKDIACEYRDDCMVLDLANAPSWSDSVSP